MFDYTDFLEWTDYEDFDNLMAATGLFDIKNYESAYYSLPEQAKDVGYKSVNFITNMKFLSFLVLVYMGKLVAFFLIKFWIFATNNRYGTKQYFNSFR